MPKIDNWRVLYANDSPFLAAIDVRGHPYVASGPIITSEIVEGEAIEGNVVRTKSGTEYTLGTPLPEDEDCEFARGLLIQRASQNLNAQGQTLRLDQLEELMPIIDEVLNRRQRTMPTEYWLVNLATKEYTKVVDNGDFFDVDDWKTQTPFADSNYIDLSMQKVWPDKKVNEHMVWGNDLCSAGMIVGIYFDKAHVTRAEVDAFLSDLRGKQDVAQAYIHELSFVPFDTPALAKQKPASGPRM